MKSDYTQADLDTPTRALLDYAVKLTRCPSEMTKTDITRLREAGWTDAAIHDTVQVISYFNYINRVADGLHVDLEPEMSPYED